MGILSYRWWFCFGATRWQGLSFGSHAGCYCIFQCPLTFSVSCSCTTWPCWGISFSLRMDLLWGVGTWCWCLEWHLKVNREIIQFLIIEIHCKPIGCFYVVLHAYSQFSFFFLKMYDVLTKLLRRLSYILLFQHGYTLSLRTSLQVFHLITSSVSSKI